MNKKMMPILLFIIMIIMMAMVGTFAPRMLEDAPEDVAEPMEMAERVQSNIIVQYGEAEASPSEISFYFQNLSDETYMYGYMWTLARYVAGVWQYVPFRPELGGRIAVSYLGHVIYAGEIKHNSIGFLQWREPLVPGRYMFIRRHNPFDSPNTPHIDAEYLLIEFTIPPEGVNSEDIP